MRRFVLLCVMLCVAAPFGAAMVGCGSKTATAVYCNGLNYGPKVGQVASVSLNPTLAVYGESVDFGRMGQVLSSSAQALDCKGNAVSVRSFTYATTNMNFADINPTTGQVCGGTWNRNSGAGIADYTTCTAPGTAGQAQAAAGPAYVTATTEGTVSNALPVYVHDQATSLVIGSPTPQASCATSNDPSTNCCPSYTTSNSAAPSYNGTSCLSQNASAQLTARVYRNGTTLPQDNITCQAGHVTFSGQNSTIFKVDQTGVVTATQPGSTIVEASLAESNSGGSLAGFLSTCPPASIVLSTPPNNSSAITLGLNDAQPVTATVTDTAGVQITGLTLTFVSTNPITTPLTSANVTPLFPGTASITAECQPPSCNPAPSSQLGLFGNGQVLVSNSVQVTTPGRSTAELFAASTGSNYLYAIDFSTNGSGALIRLPYQPNSIAISQDGTNIFLGSTTALMQVSTASLSVVSAYTTSPGNVIGISPDGTTVVVTDPNRRIVSLVSSNGSVTTSYGGLGTHAEFSADNDTVYITAGTQLLVHSAFLGWTSVPLNAAYTDVALTVPYVGAFFGGNAITEARSNCVSTVAETAANPPVLSNVYYPVANDTAAPIDRIAATDDGHHILGATSLADGNRLTDIAVTLPVQSVGGVSVPATCPTYPNAVPPTYFTTATTTQAFVGAVPATITGVVPSTDSQTAFVTYQGTGGVLPRYTPSTTGAGTLTYVPLSGTAVAPVAGVFATDNLTFYTGTSGDNLLHLITNSNGTWTDSSTLNPALPAASGTGTATPDLVVERARRATS